MYKFFYFIILLLLFACQESDPISDLQRISHQYEPTIVSPPIQHRKTVLPITAWRDLGKPLFDVDANADMFHFHKETAFEINEALKTKAESFLYPLSSEDFVSLYQDQLHYNEINKEGDPEFHQRTMYDEFLYSNQDSIFIEVNHRGQGRAVRKPGHRGFTFDFITTFTANPQDSFYQIKALFFERNRYGNPKKWDDWYSVVTKGHLISPPQATPLATYHKTDSSIYTAKTSLLRFPYFKRTEVLKELKNNYVSRIDSSIFILKFGIYRAAGHCDVKRYINGRLIHKFWQRKLKRKLRY